MLIREAGVMYQGIPIVFARYHKASKDNINLISTSGLMNGLFVFAECLIEPIEYFESNNYSIVFKKGRILNFEDKEVEIITFMILDKDYRLEHYLKITIFPLLEKILKKFIAKYKGYNFTEPTQFKSFRMTIDKILGTGTMTLEEKVAYLIS